MGKKHASQYANFGWLPAAGDFFERDFSGSADGINKPDVFLQLCHILFC